MKRVHTHFVLGVFLALMLIGTAQADILGAVWENQPTAAGDATLANVPSTPADVTFTAPTPLNFAAPDPSTYSIGDFLSSGGATVLTGSDQLDNSLDNTIFEFTGELSVTNGETFTALHDDGITLIIDGMTVIDSPGPDTGSYPLPYATSTGTYTGPTGSFQFQLVYGECCGEPAYLSVDLPALSSVPEPSSIPLLGAMLIGLTPLAFAFKRKLFFVTP